MSESMKWVVTGGGGCGICCVWNSQL